MAKKKVPGEDVVSNKPRHPDFDKMWEKHQKLVFWWANRITVALNRQRRTTAFEGSDFLGYLTLRFNYCLYYYDGGQSKFSTFFGLHLFWAVLRWVVRPDVEDLPMSLPDSAESLRTKNSEERGLHMYRIPQPEEDTEDWIKDLIELCGPDPWEFLTRQMFPREKEIADLRCRLSLPWEEIGGRLGISRERVRQLWNRLLGRLSDRIKQLEPVRKLFYGDIE
jgi:RNA polymerase sigma factor (sigma-70 family)